MASFSCPLTHSIRCSSGRDNQQDSNKQKLNNIKINGVSTFSTTKVDKLGQTAKVTTTFGPPAPIAENGHANNVHVRQNIPTQKQFADLYRQGLIIERGVGYRQTVVIRSYEVGPDRTATLESILNLLQVRRSCLSRVAFSQVHHALLDHYYINI